MSNSSSDTGNSNSSAFPETRLPETHRRDPLRRVNVARRQLERILGRTSLLLLRLSLGVVFVWFGALKIAGASPAEVLVAETMPWLAASWLVPALGGFEIGLGIALMVGYRLGWVCAAMVAHLVGTFLTVVMAPDALFHGNPFMLTMEGEFVAKNLVLITAALVIASRSRPAEPVEAPAAAMAESHASVQH